MSKSISAVSERLQVMGKVHKVGRWVPHELKERDIERRLDKCEILLKSHKNKSFLHRIVTGDEKWIFYTNLKRKKPWVDRNQPSTSTPKLDIHGLKVMLFIWWDQKGALRIGEI